MIQPDKNKPLAFARANIGRAYMICEQAPEEHFLKRWAAVHQLTRSIPRDARFDMSTFGRQADTECGTAACMAGHAMLHPWFRDQGLASTATASYATDLLFTQPGFFGTYSWQNTPFDPHFCRSVLAALYRRITPYQASEVVMAWMLYWWPKEAVDEALESTKAVQYSAAFVHKYTPWKGVRLVGPRG